MSLPLDLYEPFLAHAKALSPKECCGLIVARNGMQFYQPMLNICEQPELEFQFKPEEWAEVEDSGEIVGVCHSHPFANPMPSEADRVGCEQSNLPWYIVNPQTGELHSFAPTGYEQPLEGRKFIYGVFDCLSLVRDYYKRALSLEIQDFPRPPYEWWNDPSAPEYYENNFKAYGFHDIPLEAARTNDLILMEVRSQAHKINHVAVWIDKLPGRGGNLILHHAQAQLSEYTVYGGFWRKCTRLAIRHNSLA